jgi:hypothetical protein
MVVVTRKGAEVNSAGSENRPYVTRDGSRDTFWVQAEYLDRFKKWSAARVILVTDTGLI